MFFLAYAVEPTGCGAAMFFIQNIVEKENIKLGTSSSDQHQNVH